MKTKIKLQLKQTSQLSKMWHKYRQYRLTSSNIYRCLINDANLLSSLLPEYALDGLDRFSMNEVLVKIVYHTLIFSTGFHIHEQFSWLGTSPDGLFPFEERLLPVEIKSTGTNKTDKQIINENYHQLQLHCEIMKSDRVLLLILRTNLGTITSNFVFKDIEFCKAMIRKAEINYFRNVPKALCPELTDLQLKILLEDSKYQNKFLKLYRTDCKEEETDLGTGRKNLNWEKVELAKVRKCPNIGSESKNFLAKILASNRDRFKKKYEETFVELFDSSTEISKRIEWNLLKSLLEKGSKD